MIHKIVNVDGPNLLKRMMFEQQYIIPESLYNLMRIVENNLAERCDLES